MSDAKGPYTLNEDDAGRYVISDMPSHLATFESHLDASVAVLIANLAHHHALAAQAERVRQLEEACQEAISTLDQLEASLFAKVAPSHVAYISKEGASKCAGTLANSLRAAISKARGTT